jgi:hypothetical protein
VSYCHHFSSVIRPSTFHILIFSSETTGPIATKLWWNGPWVAPFQTCVQWSRLPTKMAPFQQNLVEIGSVVSLLAASLYQWNPDRNKLWNIRSTERYILTNDHGYVPFVISTYRSFPHSWRITVFVTRVTRRVALVEQELITPSEHISASPGWGSRYSIL